MNRILQILQQIEVGGQALMNAVPVLHTGVGGQIMAITMIADAEIAQFIQVFQSMKQANAPQPVTPQATTPVQTVGS